jgi:TetR/AcrR family transcriptional repressor of lmrAB and yxaGH operons
MMPEISSRDVLLRAASDMIRRNGYDGVGLNQILGAADLPKGSLYHHFPGGKSELAQSATVWAAAGVERLVDRIFGEASDFRSGAVALSKAIADKLEQSDKILACPVASILQAGASDAQLRSAGRAVLSGWIEKLASHADRLGQSAPGDAAETLVMLMEGAWLLALAEQSSAPFERLARRLEAGMAA